jgi:hypothetical protein
MMKTLFVTLGLVSLSASAGIALAQVHQLSTPDPVGFDVSMVNSTADSNSAHNMSAAPATTPLVMASFQPVVVVEPVTAAPQSVAVQPQVLTVSASPSDAGFSDQGSAVAPRVSLRPVIRPADISAATNQSVIDAPVTNNDAAFVEIAQVTVPATQQIAQPYTAHTSQKSRRNGKVLAEPSWLIGVFR